MLNITTTPENSIFPSSKFLSSTSYKVGRVVLSFSVGLFQSVCFWTQAFCVCLSSLFIFIAKLCSFVQIYHSFFFFYLFSWWVPGQLLVWGNYVLIALQFFIFPHIFIIYLSLYSFLRILIYIWYIWKCLYFILNPEGYFCSIWNSSFTLFLKRYSYTVFCYLFYCDEKPVTILITIS